MPDDLARQLADRLAACSACLGRLAERGGAAAEVVRLRAALEEIAAGVPDPSAVARAALGLVTKGEG